MLLGHRPAFGVSNKRTVSLRFRAQSKPRDFVSGVVTSSVDEQSSLIEKPKLGALRWFQKETYDPENLGTGSFLEKKMKEGVDCGLTEVTRLGRSRKYLLYSKGLEEVRYFPVMERGRRTLEEINQGMGLAFDEEDLQYYTRLSREDIKRNPTTVELFDVAQSNCSEHSRHWFVTGNIIIDGQPMNRTLMQIVKSTLQANPNNSVIDFRDNWSAIKGFPPRLIIADGSYSPWEDRSFPYPSNLASPLQILIDGSSINGSSDYGNKEEDPASSKETTHHIPCSKKGEKTTTGTTDGCVRRSEERRYVAQRTVYPKTITPDRKLRNESLLLGKRRLGGSALARAFDEVGNESPDLDDVSYQKKTFECMSM
ncbi:hypothetical protein OIU85_006519 [Salix viminalis]|uniref:Phosphoribosylformylglycinamidine synthase linker domain-containing protein n=1 Tax=Salix viminalis TaxID=40686 RepID=A0A9Q0PL63_SALVM|nr:hypothetical protein OIU85_006519 [Salix viminalis]